MSLERINEAPLARALLLLGFTAPGECPSLRAIALDMAERLLIAGLFGSFVHRMLLGGTEPSFAAILIVLSESLPFFFVILRAPAKTLSLRPSDWALAVSATLLPLLVRPTSQGDEAMLYAALGFGLLSAGLFLQVSAKLMLGRRFGLIPANRGVRMFGPYRFVRHPIYAGYTITHIGFLLAMPSLLNAAIYALALALQLVRIEREEAVLRQDPVYAAYAERVRYRLLPGVY